MKTREKTKLALGRETLVALDRKTLDAIVGGIFDGGGPAQTGTSGICGKTMDYRCIAE
jgi:hypothetical protein